jgi:hypothetical protein
MEHWTELETGLNLTTQDQDPALMLSPKILRIRLE